MVDETLTQTEAATITAVRDRLSVKSPENPA